MSEKSIFAQYCGYETEREVFSEVTAEVFKQMLLCDMATTEVVERIRERCLHDEQFLRSVCFHIVSVCIILIRDTSK